MSNNISSPNNISRAPSNTNLLRRVTNIEKIIRNISLAASGTVPVEVHIDEDEGDSENAYDDKVMTIKQSLPDTNWRTNTPVSFKVGGPKKPRTLNELIKSKKEQTDKKINNKAIAISSLLQKYEPLYQTPTQRNSRKIRAQVYADHASSRIIKPKAKKKNTTKPRNNTWNLVPDSSGKGRILGYTKKNYNMHVEEAKAREGSGNRSKGNVKKRRLKRQRTS
jgi:hypothetical protein